MNIDCHRWYAVISDEQGNVVGVVGCLEGGDGLAVFDSVEEWEASNG